jgi:protein SDA1
MSGGPGAGATGIAETVEKLATLQNLVKRDPDTYADEFKLQHQNFLAELEIFKLNPSSPADTFVALIHFLAHVSSPYRHQLAAFPRQLIELLTDQADVLHSNVRLSLAQALILMRNKGLLQPTPLLKAFFSLFRVKDKHLRDMLYNHIVHDIKNINKIKKDESANRAIQSFMYGMLKDESAIAAKKSLEVMVELYRRRVWVDEATINVIASALLLGKTKLLVVSLKFFLGIGSESGEESGSDDDSDDDNIQLDPKQVRQALQTHSHSKHTKKRQRQTVKMLAGMKKNARKAAHSSGPVFPAIQLLHDPQGMADKLFNILRSTGERFEIRLMMMNFVSRLIGQHRLIVLPFYTFVQKYLNAHQANVTQVLAYLVQVRYRRILLCAIRRTRQAFGSCRHATT